MKRNQRNNLFAAVVTMAGALAGNRRNAVRLAAIVPTGCAEMKKNAGQGGQGTNYIIA